MGDGNNETTSIISLLPVSALSADCKYRELCLKLQNTLKGGRLQGIVEPVWSKTMESEQRIAWLGDMLKRELVVRDIMNFGHSVNEKLRADSSREEELGRGALLD